MATTLSLGDIIRNNARHHPDAPALIDQDNRTLSHAEYLHRCLKLAGALRAMGAGHQARVAMMGMNSIAYSEFYGACELAGFIAMTVNFRLAPAEVLTLLADSGPKVVLFEAAYAEPIAAAREQLTDVAAYVCLGDGPSWALSYEEFLNSGEGEHLPRSTPDDIAHLIYTSGSTGRPKGCMLGHRESVAKGQLHAGDLGITPEDRMLIVMPLFHVGARGLQSAAQWRGAAVYLQRTFDPEQYLRLLERERITIVHLAPSMIQTLVEHPLAQELDFSALRVLFYAAAPMPVPVLRRGIELFGNIFHQSYGQTEGAVSALLRCQHRPDGDERERRRLASVGQPLPGVEVRIMDDEGRELPAGASGEIVYRGGVMFRGYWNDSNATTATLRQGWIYSGDLGQLDADGFLYIVDRKKDMIISGGENIYSREVEEALLRHAAVAEAAVIGVPHPRWGETVRAVVSIRKGASANEADLIAHCRTLMASYKKPTSICFAPDLPKLPNGKIDKVLVRRLYGDGAELGD